MKIVHVCRQFSPGIGGLEDFVKQLALHQNKSVNEVKVVTLNKIFDDTETKILSQNETIDGIEICRVGYIGSRRYPIALGIIRHLASADVVHVHGMDFLSDYLSITKFLHKRKLVLSTHGGFFHTEFAARLKQFFFHTMTRLTLRSYNEVIACSLQDHAMIRPIRKRNLYTIENGVDTKKFSGLANAGARKMIFFGRLAPNKNIEQLIKWFSAFHAIDTRWSLIIAGKPMGCSEEVLRAAAKTHGIENKIEFHSTPSDEELKCLIGQSSVYVCASAYEGFGLAAVEAVSAGLYPVLSAIPAFERTIARLGFGQCIDFSDVAQDTLQTINAAIESQQPQNYAEAVAPFDWAVVAQQFESVYRCILGRDVRKIGRINVSVLSQARALECINKRIDDQERGFIAFCNAHSVNVASKSARFSAAMAGALVLNDGVGVSMASKILFGHHFPDNLNGTDFVPALLQSRQKKTSVFVIGSAPGVAERAGREFERRFPNISVTGSEHGFVSGDMESGVVDRIAALKPDITLVGMGQPAQELWAARNAEAIGGTVMCVGALLDFYAGVVTRAPAWIRHYKLEWLYRLYLEPRRLAGRYLAGNVQFLLRILGQRVTGVTFSAQDIALHQN